MIGEEPAKEPPASDPSDPDPLALIAHDLRSPLSILKGALVHLSGRAARRFPLAPQQRDLVELALRSARLLEDLIDGIVASRLPLGAPSRRPTALREVLSSAIDGVLSRLPGGPDEGDAAAAHGIEIDAEGAVLDAPVALPRVMLVRVVMNLVGNALKHAPGPVRIHGSRSGDGLELAVIDEGPGLPDDVKRLLSGTDGAPPSPPERPRAGLGVPATRWLVDRLGGSLRCEAGASGKGTTIVVALPAAFASAEG